MGDVAVGKTESIDYGDVYPAEIGEHSRCRGMYCDWAAARRETAKLLGDSRVFARVGQAAIGPVGGQMVAGVPHPFVDDACRGNGIIRWEPMTRAMAKRTARVAIVVRPR